MKKLTKLMQWREEYGNTLIVASELENDYAQFFYFRGYDSFGSPIAWFRASVMPWGKVDIDAFVRMVVYQIDRAVATFMPRGTEGFTCVIDATGIGGMQVFSIVKLLKKLADIFVNGFPDRLASLLVMPCSGTIQTIYGMIKGVLPASITKKVKLVDADVRQLSFSPYSLTISLSLSLSLSQRLSRAGAHSSVRALVRSRRSPPSTPSPFLPFLPPIVCVRLCCPSHSQDMHSKLLECVGGADNTHFLPAALVPGELNAFEEDDAMTVAETLARQVEIYEATYGGDKVQYNFDAYAIVEPAVAKRST